MLLWFVIAHKNSILKNALIVYNTYYANSACVCGKNVVNDKEYGEFFRLFEDNKYLDHHRFIHGGGGMEWRPLYSNIRVRKVQQLMSLYMSNNIDASNTILHIQKGRSSCVSWRFFQPHTHKKRYLFLTYNITKTFLSLKLVRHCNGESMKTTFWKIIF